MGTAVPIRGRTPFLQSCSLELPMLLQRLAISEVAMVDMAMEDMVAMGATGMERDLLKPKLMLNQDTPEVMDMEVMVAMDVATTERGRLTLNQDTPEAMVMVVMDMEVMDVDTMARGKLAMVVMDMVVMAVHMEVMVDMDIAVKFVLLFIISPPPYL